MSDFVLLTDYSCAAWKMDLGECNLEAGKLVSWNIVVAWMEGSDGGEGM